MKKKEAAKLLEEIACVFPRMSATLVVRGERIDAQPFIDGAGAATGFAAILLDGYGDVDDLSAVEAAELILNAATDYYINGGKEE